MSSSQLGDRLCKSEVRSLQRKLNRAQFLLSSYKTRRMFMAKMHKSESLKML